MDKKIIKVALLPALFTMLLVACSKAPVHEHTFSNEWSTDESFHWHAATCEHKEEVSEKAAHEFVKGETIAPTKEAQGYTVYTCSVCHYTKNDDFTDYVDPYQARIKSKDFKVINLSYEKQNPNDPRQFEESKPLTNTIKEGTYKLYYLDEVNEIYYIPLSTYVDLFKGDFKDDVVNTVVEENGVATWTLTLGKDTYTLSLDKNNQTITTKGNIEEFFKPVPNGRTGIFDQASIVTTYVEGREEKAKTFSFKEYGFDVFETDGKICFPFALIAAETSKYVERKFINVSYYNYLVEFIASEQYMDYSYLDDENKERNISDLMRDSYKQLYGVEDKNGFKYPEAPQALTEFNKKIIYYVFNNYYGLASTKGIKSMSSYLDNLEESKNFTATNGIVRASAYAHALQGMNDLHTSYGASPFLNEGAYDNAVQDQSLYKDRMNLAALLNSLREREIEAYNKAKSTSVTSKRVRYSDDGKYAYFSFDKFDSFNYFEQGDIPDDELFSDTYYQFVMNLNEIKDKKTVKRVFIDDSLNGGGYVAIMGKLLALLSKDNRSVMYLRDSTDNSIQSITTRVDSNKDGVYDEKDCYGNDFEFFVVTSSYSFSCGNAFPFYADQNGYAKIIGSRSGGGECCVFNFTLPTGQSIGYSSPYHIGQYFPQATSSNNFMGDESGVYPWLEPNVNFNIYNVNQLAEFVTLKKPF